MKLVLCVVASINKKKHWLHFIISDCHSLHSAAPAANTQYLLLTASRRLWFLSVVCVCGGGGGQARPDCTSKHAHQKYTDYLPLAANIYGWLTLQADRSWMCKPRDTLGVLLQCSLGQCFYCCTSGAGSTASCKTKTNVVIACTPQVHVTVDQ